jgi:branched-chain amino acid transport system ATP-binding protein
MTPLLRTNGISVKFGGLVAVNAVDIAIPEGVIHGVIGPNGAGQDDVLQRDHRPRRPQHR